MTLPILEVQQISKRYSIQHLAGGYLSLRERISQITKFKKQQRNEDFWALKDVSFAVAQGESIGIIGRNGAGKSTLLKILSRITPPTRGRVVMRGRIASLLEVGTGFHPELTGRENIFFNGSLLGMKRREIESKFDEIVDFSGTERFLDTPLKHYSSGMQLRLAFSVAAFLEPEILVIDEVLAVGDAEFQKKCLGKMEDVSKSGRTILFVSHNMAAVENLCQHGIMLAKGSVAKHGSMSEVVSAYQQSFRSTFTNEWNLDKAPSSAAFLKRVTIDLRGEQPNHTVDISCTIGTQSTHKDMFIAFDVMNSRGITIFQAIPNVKPFIKYSQEDQTIKTEIDLPPLIPDQYKVSVWLGSHNTETICWEKEIVEFEIYESPTKGRNFPHSHHNGFLVPNSRIVHD
jgi:lipopolysaccharide transport system ATP-binding protein